MERNVDESNSDITNQQACANFNKVDRSVYVENGGLPEKSQEKHFETYRQRNYSDNSFYPNQTPVELVANLDPNFGARFSHLNYSPLQHNPNNFVYSWPYNPSQFQPYTSLQVAVLNPVENCAVGGHSYPHTPSHVGGFTSFNDQTSANFYSQTENKGYVDPSVVPQFPNRDKFDSESSTSIDGSKNANIAANQGRKNGKKNDSVKYKVSEDRNCQSESTKQRMWNQRSNDRRQKTNFAFPKNGTNQKSNMSAGGNHSGGSKSRNEPARYTPNGNNEYFVKDGSNHRSANRQRNNASFNYASSANAKDENKSASVRNYSETNDKYKALNSNTLNKPIGRNKDESLQTNHTVSVSKQIAVADGNSSIDDDSVHSLKDRLIDQLTRGNYECMVCCECIRQTVPIWSCNKCYHVFHLYCIKKWAQCTKPSEGWRCPACQNTLKDVPNRYMCFCAKKRNPWWNHRDVPHTCGEICKKSLPGFSCPHHCTELCHPGPCSPCALNISKTCECGKTKEVVRCGQKDNVTCNQQCGKDLNCKIHNCENVCHVGPCDNCQVEIEQKCFCGQKTRTIECSEDSDEQDFFPCGSVCNKMLSCGHHRCEKLCHGAECLPCQLVTEYVRSCPCGQVALKDLYEEKDIAERASCLDPIPTCDNVCGKDLKCGSVGDRHTCQSVCHTGQCPPCPLTTLIDCRCKFLKKDVACRELGDEPITCKKRCNKKLSCKRHKCLQNCCVDAAHACDSICNRRLSCNQHNCQDECHRGDCQRCWQVSFDELTCHCGAAVIYPPIACGTNPPECKEICSMQHSCKHQVLHNCHGDEKCPPCTFLTSKWCYGKHELRKSVPCYLEYVSCGKRCGKRLKCGIHSCLKTCHSDDCENEKCSQLCTNRRDDCGHPCGRPCHHKSPCPPTICKHKVSVTCQCGRLSESALCSEVTKPQLSAVKLATKMHDIREGRSVNMKELLSVDKIKRLECNDDCLRIERNQRLALALQIENPDLSSKLGPPAYSEWLKEQTRNNLKFVSDSYEKIASLVTLAKQSKQKSRSLALPSMKRDHRRIVHELAELFGCESQAVDYEPNRMVVITAVKDKCWLPSVSIMTIIERKMGLRKLPPPVLPSSISNMDAAKTNSATSLKSPAQSSNAKKFDYFDMS